MKKTQILLGLTGGIFLFVISSVPAAEIKKGNTGNVLNNTASWVGGIIPTNNDVAVWDSTVTTAARCTNGLNVNMTWAGIKILNPIASFYITNTAANNRHLYLLGSGIDMSGAAPGIDLTMTNLVHVNAAQTWNIPTTHTFTMWTNTGICGISNNLNITGGGTVQYGRQIDIATNSTLTIEGGSVVVPLVSPDSFIRVGTSLSGGTLNQTSGTLTLGRIGTGNIVAMQLGISDFTATGAKATYNLSGGTLIATNATTNSYQIALGQNAGGASIMNVSGSAQCYADRLIVGGAGPGTLNISDLGAVFIRNTFVVANAVAGIGVVNLNGGSLNVPGMTRNSAGLATNNFNGGTLVAGTNNPFFMQAGFILNVLAGGARIDTAGYDITIDQPFLHASGGTTDGGLQKFGSGTLTLSGLNDYNGDTVIKGGKLVLSTVVQSKGAIALDNNTTLGLTLSGAGVTLYCQTLTLGTSVGSVLEFNLNGFGNPTTPVLNVSNLTANGTCLVNIIGTGLAPGQFPLIQYTNATGVTDATFVTNSLPNGLVAYMSNNVANSSIDLVVVSAASILWTGSTNSVPVGIWDVGVTANWIDPATSLPAAFSSGTSVRFDDSAPGTTTITLAGEVAPGNTVISNETKAYSIAGVNAIAGTGRFIKEGAADLTLSTPNTYSGDTLISAGKLILGTTNVIPDGVGKGDVVLNGTLDTAGFNETINGLSGSGVLDNSLAGVTNTVGIGNNNAGGTFSGTVVNSGGVLILSKQGNGIITLSGNNTYSGGTMASGTGILQLGHPNALGTGPLTMAGGTLSSDSTTSRTITNDLFMTGNNTYGSSSNTGVLTLSGNIDFGGAIRTLNINSDVIFAGTSLMTNGGLNIKNSPGTLTIRSNLCRWFSAIEVRGGAFVVDGATLTNGDAIRINSILNNGVSRFVITNGGLVVITNPASNLRPGYTGGNATATNIADIAGTLRLAIGGTAGGVDMGQLSARAIVNLLPGGVLEARQIVHNSGVSEFNFRGGILRVTTNSAGTNFMQGLTVANVQDGGAVIDTAGFDITIGQALLAGGTAGLSKQGLGMLTLAGTNNTYTGTTVINQGRVAWRSTNFTASPVLVKNGAACRAIVSTVGSAIGIPAVTLGESAGQTTTLDVDLGTLGFPTVAPVIITNFTTRGTVRIGFVGSGLTVGGPFPLIQYEGGTINGDGWAAIQAAPPAGTQVTLTDDGTTIYAEITSSEAIRWTGAANTNWDIAISTNWLSGVDAIAYTEGSAVRFEDGAAAANVYLLTTLRPSGIVVSNNSLNYTFFGPGLIAGGYGLTKSGAGSLTISNTGSTYSNDTVIEAGTLILGTNNVIPDGTNRGLAVVNGTLDLAGYNETINGLSGNGIVDTTTADKTNILTINALTNSTFAGNIRNSGLNSVLSVTKTGTNVITLAGLSTYSGYTSNDNGALRVGANQALGTGRILMYGGTLASDSVNARVLPNALFCNAGITLGDSNNTGTLTFNGTVDLNAAARNVTTLSDIVFAGGSTNGRANKLGPATLTLKGGHLWNGDAETRNGTLILDGAMLTNSGAFRPDGDQTNGLARVVITNGSWLVLTSATSNLRIGSDALTGATNIVDVAAAVRMPVADGANGRIILGQDCARGILNTFPGADLEVRTFEHASVASEVNFNGGIVRAKTNSLLYMQGLTVVNILNGGISFDSAGWDISIRQSMQGTGGLTKIGAGTLRLKGSNTYTGINTVSQGTLWMNSFSQNGNPIVVADGAVLAVDAAAPAATLAASSLTLGSASGAALEVNLPFAEGTNAPLIRVSDLSAPAAVTINLATVVTPGRYTLIQYTNAGTLAGFNLGTKPATVTASLTHDSGAKIVYLDVTGVDALAWSGVDTNWDVGTSTNWMLVSSLAAAAFSTGDNVLFDDLGSNAPIVSLVAGMAPSTVTVLNTNVNYAMTSTGKLVGAMMLVKDGPGSLSLSNQNEYTGLTRVQGGTLILGATNALGSISGATYITNGGTLDVNGNNAAYEPVVVSGAGVSNAGAIYNRGASQINAFRDVTMTGDTTFGGTGRWDIRTITVGEPGLRANGFNLTKVGTGIVGIRAESGSYFDSGLGNIDIQSGTISLEYNATLGLAANNLSVNSNANFQIWQLVSTNVLKKNFFMTNGTLISGSTATGSTNTLSGPFVIEGSNAFRLNANGPTTNRLVIASSISGPGGLTRDFNAMTNSDLTLELQGTNSYFGPTILREGRTILGPQAALFNTASIELGSNVVFDLSAVAEGLNLTNQTLRGEGTLLGSVTATGGAVIPGGDGTAKTLTLSNHASFSGSEFKLDLSQATTVGGGTNDLIVVGGNLALTGSNLVSLSFVGGVSPTGGTYTIIRYTGSLTGGAANLQIKTHSYVVTFDDTVTN
jgi:autotransporter-associated beta strand protein